MWRDGASDGFILQPCRRRRRRLGTEGAGGGGGWEGVVAHVCVGKGG